jgi:DNA-binding Lrp family transcriptional regulator
MLGVCLEVIAMLSIEDKLLLNRIQENFPVDARPYAVIGTQLGMPEEEVLERITRLKEAGFIRRIGPFYNSRNFGYASTLVGFAVPEDKVEDAARIINEYKGVTHNYIRSGTYNMWFTFIAASKEHLENSLNDIREKTGLHKMLILPATRMFKVNVNLRLLEDEND